MITSLTLKLTSGRLCVNHILQLQWPKQHISEHAERVSLEILWMQEHLIFGIGSERNKSPALASHCVHLELR